MLDLSLKNLPIACMGPFPKFNRAEASYELFCSLCLRHFNSKLQVLCAIVKGTMQNSSMVSFNGSEYRRLTNWNRVLGPLIL